MMDSKISSLMSFFMLASGKMANSFMFFVVVNWVYGSIYYFI